MPPMDIQPAPPSQEKKEFGVLASGEKVFDRIDSHIDDHPEVKEYLFEALKKISSGDRLFIAETVDFEKPVGKSFCIETNEDDEIIYAQRPKRFGKTRFVKNREPVQTSKVTTVLKKDGEAYVLISAYIGEQTGPEPWSKFADETSIHFWNTHAIIWGSQEIIPGTESLTP